MEYVDFVMSNLCLLHFQLCVNPRVTIAVYLMSPAGRTVNQFLNKNANEVVGELHEELGRALGEIFLPILQRAFGQIPTEHWLLD